MWSGYSLWYFLDAQDKHLFIVRPWWGRRIVLDLESGKLLAETVDISGSAAAYEKQYVMAELGKGVESRTVWEKNDSSEAAGRVLEAAYLAGRLPVREAAPLLKLLQGSPHVGEYATGGLGSGERFEGEVNPHSYETFSVRQVAQLSLRRLGMTPQALPATRFEVEYPDYKKNRPYEPKTTAIPRAVNAGKVAEGMKAEMVLDLLGGPDFVGYDSWEYDMDATRPFSLLVRWDARQVIDVQKRPPLWKEGFVRDEQIVR